MFGEAGRGLTVRALATGMAMSLGIGLVGYYLEVYIQGANPTLYFTSQIAHVILFILMGVVNTVVGTLRRSWAFARGELLVIFIMMCLANGTHVLVYYWIALVPSPIYFSRPENDWGYLLVPHIPDWLIPHDPIAIRSFYEGAPGDHPTFPGTCGWNPLPAGSPPSSPCTLPSSV